MKYLGLLCLLGTLVFAQANPGAQTNNQSSNTLNIKNDCGASGNGSTDDSNSIQGCINQAWPGATLYFPNGTYNISKPLNIRGGVNYVGQSGNTVLHATRMGLRIFQFPWSGGSDVTVDTLTFDSGGINTNGNGQIPTNVHITNSTFQNLTQTSGNWTEHNFIYIDNGLKDSQIDHNSFQNAMPGGSANYSGQIDFDGDLPRSGIWAYGLDNTSIDHNSFDQVYQGIKNCQVLPYQTKNVYIGWNVITNLHRMGIEVQDATGCGQKTAPGATINSQNYVIENNTISNWQSYYWGSFGISFANTPVDTVIVRNNTITAPAYMNGSTPNANSGMGIEVGGRPALVYGNTLKGPWGASIAVFSGSRNSDVYNNYACDPYAGGWLPGIADEMNPSPTDTYYHNNVTTKNCN